MNGFRQDLPVLVKYPLTPEQEHGDRAAWPWLPGEVVQRCDLDEWQIIVLAPELEDADGTFPLVFRDASEIRAVGGTR